MTIRIPISAKALVVVLQLIEAAVIGALAGTGHLTPDLAGSIVTAGTSLSGAILASSHAASADQSATAASVQIGQVAQRINGSLEPAIQAALHIPEVRDKVTELAGLIGALSSAITSVAPVVAPAPVVPASLPLGLSQPAPSTTTENTPHASS